MIKTLFCGSDKILWEIPAGKVDTSELVVNPVNDLRPRVMLAAQKGDTCWYYAIKRLRSTYGKNSTHFFQEREIEKKFSGFRKEATFICELEKTLIGFFCTSEDNAHRIGQEMQNNEKLKKVCSDFWRKLTETGKNDSPFLLEEIKEYITELRYNSANKFFEELQLSHSEIMKANLKTDLPLMTEEFVKAQFLKVDSETRKKFLNWHIKRKYLDELGFLQCDWSPEKSIDHLIALLKLNGPLLMHGKLGSVYYNAEAQKSAEKAKHRSIWFWKAGTYNENYTEDSHACVIVGAKNLSREKYVYFIDPNDSSNPCDPETQKIYKISFNRFVLIAKSYSLINQPKNYTKECCFLFYNPRLPNFKNVFEGARDL